MGDEIADMTGVTKITKGLVNGFRQKFEIFPCFYFWHNQPAKCVHVILESKKRFKTIKNRNLKKSKNQDFSKGVLYFRQNRPGKCI